jgi:epoxyqueuosine reductase
MKILKEPTYKRYVTGPFERFDDRMTGFSRGRVDPAGSKYDKMHQRSVENIRKNVKGKTVLDHGLWVAGRTVDYVMRRTQYGRETVAQFNREFKVEDRTPADLTKIIKRVARWLGADLVGVAKLNRSWVYSRWGDQNAHYSGAAQPGDPIELPEEYQYAIVLVQEMDYDMVKRSPAVEADTDLVYATMGFTACSLATYISEIGYKAIPSVNELGIDVAFAVDAGLGEMGRMGLLMTREFGPRCRIGKVFTNLPLEVDQPIDIGVQAFCEKCERCSVHCPSGAIKSGARTEEPWDESNNRGMLKWPVHAMKCLDWWVKNGSHCSVCIRVCPWNKPNTLFHRGIRFMAERDMFTKLMVSADEWMGYGKQSVNFFD